LEHDVTYPDQNPQDAAVQQRDAETNDRDREAYERYVNSHPELAQNAPSQPAEAQQNEPEEPQKRENEFSHYLQLANGDFVKFDSADGPVPAAVEGVPVAAAYQATVGGPT
jgi:ferric-dicitrate binding protein FerR (iron transport regulator)